MAKGGKPLLQNFGARSKLGKACRGEASIIRLMTNSRFDSGLSDGFCAEGVSMMGSIVVLMFQCLVNRYFWSLGITLIIQATPNLFSNIPKRGDQKVLVRGI